MTWPTSIAHSNMQIVIDRGSGVSFGWDHKNIVFLACNLEGARELCQTALNLNTENPLAIMLMALIFTARKDYKGALELV
jgi:hypothetical protein